MGLQTDLKDQHCVPIEKGAPALKDARIAELVKQLSGWKTNSPTPGQPLSLRKEFSFSDFLGAMAFVNKVAALAEEEQHHPDLSIHYDRVEVSLSTHTVGGLSENDFILAAKLDSLF